MRSSKPLSFVARLAALLASFIVLAVACNSGGSGAGAPSSTPPSSGSSPDIAGQTITVLLPPWANVPQSMLQQFTKETGVKVDFQVTGWDAIRNKVAVAGAGNTALADVTEFDWSWTGQFGRAGWYLPLQSSLDPALVSDLQNNGAFSIGANQYAVCYSNDFRISAYNTKVFSDAGIQQPPATFGELVTDLQTIKSKGLMDAPLTMPLSATEGTSTVWYLLTLAYGGNLFDSNFKPAFTSPDSAGYKALAFMVNSLKQGLVTPGAVSLTDSQSDNRYTSGTAAVTLAGGPDEHRRDARACRVARIAVRRDEGRLAARRPLVGARPAQRHVRLGGQVRHTDREPERDPARRGVLAKHDVSRMVALRESGRDGRGHLEPARCCSRRWLRSARACSPGLPSTSAW